MLDLFHRNSLCGTTGMCNRSSECAGGACCMPTRFGSYCTDVTYLVTTYNKFASPWCKCDLAENQSLNRVGGVVTGGTGGFGSDLQQEWDVLNQPLLDPHGN